MSEEGTPRKGSRNLALSRIRLFEASRGKASGPVVCRGRRPLWRPALKLALILGLAVILLEGLTSPVRLQPVSATGQEKGAVAFERHCSACHGSDGSGTEGGPPPLRDSPWVAGPEGALIRIVLHGLRGPIQVGGKTYNLEMPGFAGQLSDGEIAAVLTFVRHRWGGRDPAVAAETVRRLRFQYRGRERSWTAEELAGEP